MQKPLDSRPSGLSEIRHRSISGVKALTARTFVSVVLRAVSSLVLAHLLFPRDYGLFGVAAYVTGLGLFLSDIGLGGALVRQHLHPSDDETVTVFCAQQIITAIIVATLIVCAPLMIEVYRLTPSAGLLLKAMAVGLFFSSLRVVPVMALERDLRFAEVARCEMIENVAQTASTILLAYCGAGAWALAGGGLIRGAVGLVCVWAVSPWRPRGRFRWPIVTQLAKFGIPFQLNAIVPTLIGAWLPLAVSRLLGVAALGFVNWAINLASIPQMLSAVLYRVAFPALSRLQTDASALLESVRSSIRRVGTALALFVPIAIILVPALVPIIFDRRWVPATALVQWFCAETLLLTINSLICAAQNAAGYANDRLWVALGTGLLRCCLGYACIAHFGLAAIGPAQAGSAAVELYISVVVLGSRLKDNALRISEVFVPLLRTAVFLAVALELGKLIGHSTTARTLISLTAFAAATLLHSLFDKEKIMFVELRGLSRMLGRTQVQQSV